MLYDVGGRAGAPFCISPSRIGARRFGELLGLTTIETGALASMWNGTVGETLELSSFEDVRSFIASHSPQELAEKNLAEPDREMLLRKLAAFDRAGLSTLLGEHELNVCNLFLKSYLDEGYVSLISGSELSDGGPLYFKIFTWMLDELSTKLVVRNDPVEHGSAQNASAQGPAIDDSAADASLVIMLEAPHAVFDFFSKRSQKVLAERLERLRQSGIAFYFICPDDRPLPEELQALIGISFEKTGRAEALVSVPRPAPCALAAGSPAADPRTNTRASVSLQIRRSRSRERPLDRTEIDALLKRSPVSPVEVASSPSDEPLAEAADTTRAVELLPPSLPLAVTVTKQKVQTPAETVRRRIEEPAAPSISEIWRRSLARIFG